MSVRDSPSFRTAIASLTLGTISSIEEMDLASVIENIDRPCFAVSCYTDRARTIRHRFRRFILILHNSYLLSFVDNMGLAWLHHLHRQPLTLAPFTTGLSRKFVAEQMYRLGPSSMSRVLFLETMLAHEPAWRKPIEARSADPALTQASHRLTAMTADFLLHHEIGHTATADTRYHLLVRLPVEEALSSLDLSDLTEPQIRTLHEEVEADIFGIDCCFALYAPLMGEERIREYLTFVARATISLNMLYAFADDLQRRNVDPAHPCQPIEQTHQMLAIRELNMVEHIAAFAFGGETIPAGPADDLLAIGDASELFEAIMSGTGLVDAPSDDLRRAADVIDAGFAGGDFDAVINGVRASWTLYRR